MKSQPSRDRYLVEAVLRACDILESFRSPGELLRISDVADRAGLCRPTALRLLYTLERRGLVERDGSRYRLSIRPLKQRSLRIGYGSHSGEFSFSRDVAGSLARAARQAGVNLLTLDHRYSPKAAVRNAETFVREKVDLVVEFQADEHFAAPVISSKLMEAGIPLIAVEIPHPGGAYYGANNYHAGLLGGRYLGRWAKQHWRGEADEVVLLELQMSGPIPAARLTGTLAGLREVLPSLAENRIVRLNGNGRFGTSLEVMRKRLRQSGARRVLVAAINDPSAIGALRAFEECGRADRCAVMGQNASVEARVEMRRPGSRLVGSVAYFPETYGDGIIALALDILAKKPVPPAVFTKHQLITPENVDRFYSGDALLAPDVDAALLRSHS